MQVLEAIRTRRSIGKLTDVRPSRQEIETILDAGTWAPSHHVTNPWRFVVIAGDERQKFGEISARSKLERMEREGRSIAGEADVLIRKAFRAPVIIGVGVEPADRARIVEIEEVESGAAAVQNMLLAAHSLGLAAMWRTGDAAYDPQVRAYLGLSERGHVLGFIYVGHAAIEKERTEHVAYNQITDWRGWAD